MMARRWGQGRAGCSARCAVCDNALERAGCRPQWTAGVLVLVLLAACWPVGDVAADGAHRVPTPHLVGAIGAGRAETARTHRAVAVRRPARAVGGVCAFLRLRGGAGSANDHAEGQGAGRMEVSDSLGTGGEDEDTSHYARRFRAMALSSVADSEERDEEETESVFEETESVFVELPQGRADEEDEDEEDDWGSEPGGRGSEDTGPGTGWGTSNDDEQGAEREHGAEDEETEEGEEEGEEEEEEEEEEEAEIRDTRSGKGCSARMGCVSDQHI
jgi:hypothetical protein